MAPGVGLVEDARAVVVGRLRARRGEVVQALFARVRGDAFGPVGAQDAEYVAGLRAAVAAALEYVLSGIERGEGGWSGPVPVVAVAQARRAARVGVTLDTVLRRYVVGHTLLEEFVMEEAEHGWRDWPASTRRVVLRDVQRAQAAALDRLLQAITAAYGDELAWAGRSPQQRRCERVRALLEGGRVEGAELDSELEYDLGGWHLGMIATGAGAARVLGELAAGVDRRLLSVPQGRESVWGWLGGKERLAFTDLERVLTGAVPRDGVIPPDGVLPPEGVQLALGEPAQGLAGWRLTHQQAQTALVVALRRSEQKGITSTRYADVALLAAVLKDDALARALIDIYLAPLEDSRGSGQVLRETLRAYLGAERSVSSTAAALGVARKTVESRLRTIEERLGRTLRPCPTELEIALHLDELVSLSERP